uniref:Uncharacterized protein n=1 Tax=Panagrolaimus superbus TaxID=310955 RepID=A0A914XR90_9BILA
MAVLSFFGICFILAITVLEAQEQSLESICEVFPQLQICSNFPSTTPSSTSLTNGNSNKEIIKPLGYKASVLAKAFEPHRPSYMRFGKRDFGDELLPPQSLYKKYSGKQKSSYMRFGKRSSSNIFDMADNQ